MKSSNAHAQGTEDVHYHETVAAAAAASAPNWQQALRGRRLQASCTTPTPSTAFNPSWNEFWLFPRGISAASLKSLRISRTERHHGWHWQRSCLRILSFDLKRSNPGSRILHLQNQLYRLNTTPLPVFLINITKCLVAGCSCPLHTQRFHASSAPTILVTDCYLPPKQPPIHLCREGGGGELSVDFSGTVPKRQSAGTTGRGVCHFTMERVPSRILCTSFFLCEYWHLPLSREQHKWPTWRHPQGHVYLSSRFCGTSKNDAQRSLESCFEYFMWHDRTFLALRLGTQLAECRRMACVETWQGGSWSQ